MSQETQVITGVKNTVSTELDAVNTMLAAIGESPVNALLGSLPADVAVAMNTLEETMREIQLEGWHFNTEEDYPLIPGQDGRIRLSPTTVRVWKEDPDGQDIVQRGLLLYDRANHSFRFDSEVRAFVLTLLPFDAMPETFRWYVTIRAARRFQDRVVGSGDLHTFTQQDEMHARVMAEREDNKLARPSIAKGQATSFLEGGWTVGATLRR